MVIIRESPNAKEPKDQPQWPPRSPHEALLSSPSGRKRLQRIRDGRSPSPSPRRPVKTTPRKAMSIPSSDSEEEDEDEDEETLQLKLKAIEAKLKLKKLQKAKKEGTGLEKNGSTELRAASSMSSRTGRTSALEPPVTFKPEVEVPLSPVRKTAAPAEPKSPARTLLGIDKGLKAQDVSLKRPKQSSSISRTGSLRTSRDNDLPKPKSFSERIAESRLSAQEQQTKEQRIQDSRSRGFGLQTTGANDVFGSSRPASVASRPASKIPDASSRTSSRSESRGATAGAQKPGLSRTDSFREKTANRANINSLRIKPSATSKSADKPAEPATTSRATTPAAQVPEEDTASLESYSGIHLSKRHIDHTTLTRTLQGKELYPIPRLLHEIKGPHYEPPDCESDYVIFGVVCSKSIPRDHKNNPKSIDTTGNDATARPKFMVFRLTDFKYEIDLFLFDTGFERWWKLKEGQLIAVLNPGVMPPRKKDTDAFSLKVTSSEDTVLEIGTARDLGFCKSIKADGHQCTAWIDKRKTEVCEYHISLQVDKARAERMQFSTMTGGPGAGRGGRGGSFGRGRGRGKDGLTREGMYHDKFLHETMWITPKDMGLNAASLLDQEYKDEVAHKEALRKRKSERAKEEELARSLGLKSNGTGSEYLKHRTSLKEAKDRRTTTTASTQNTTSSIPSQGITSSLEPPDAASLGLLGKTAAQVDLAPIKRKFASSTSTSGSGTISSAPMGWGGAFKRGLLEPKDPPPPLPPPVIQQVGEKKKIILSPGKSSLRGRQQNEEGASPRKKARLLLEGKGVRVPGRESLGVTPGDVFLEDDEDDLEIV